MADRRGELASFQKVGLLWRPDGRGNVRKKADSSEQSDDLGKPRVSADRGLLHTYVHLVIAMDCLQSEAWHVPEDISDNINVIIFHSLTVPYVGGRT